METISKYKGYITTAIICLVVGFFIGRGNKIVKEYHTIEYRQSDPVKIDVPYPFPVKETHTIINEKLVPGEKVIVPGETIRDTVFIIDTVGVVNDYMMERSYSHTFFNNKEQGKLTVNSVVQYNKQKNIGIDYQPVTKVETIKQIIEPTWTPFLSGGYDTNGSVILGGGIFYHDIGFEYGFNQNLNYDNNSHQFKIKYKF